MSKEKQIEEMAEYIFGNAITHDTRFKEDCRSIARDLYNAGYRKQSEWISVDERLPEELTHVIVCDEDGTVGEAFCYKEGRFEWMDSEEIVFATHWMPLPEAPKVSDMAGYIKLDKTEPLPTEPEDVLGNAAKSLQDWMWEAYKKAIKEQIAANTVLIDKHFAKTNRIIVDNFDIPPMICGLEIKVTEELPDGYSFALVEAVKSERDRIIEKAKAEVAREIFADIDKILKDQERYLYCNPSLAYVYELIEELKKKYTGGE